MANEVFPIKSKKHFETIKMALRPGRDRNLLLLGTSFGLRISDLLSLKVGQLRGKKSLTIVEQKRKKKRVITFSASVIEIVSSIEGNDDDYVFASRKGSKPISRVQAYRILTAAVDRAGLTKEVGQIGTHSLRKSFGWRLYENGINITRIMSILGHSSERETLRYIGVTADEIADAYESIDVL